MIRNVIPTLRRGGVHRIHTRSVHHEQCSLLTSTNMHCVLVAQELQSHLCAHEHSLSSGQPCHLLAGPHLTFSLPVHNTKHHLDSSSFSKTTLYIENLFQKLHFRKATQNIFRMSIARVAETCEQTLPQVMGPKSLRPKSLRQFLEVLWKTFINYTMYRERIWRTRSTRSNY